MFNHHLDSLVCVALLFSVAPAQDAVNLPATLPEALARIDQLEAENEALRTQIRELEGVVTQLRGKPLPPDMDSAGAPPVPGDVPGDAEPTPAQRPYTSALDLLKKLPSDLELTAAPGPRHE